MGTARAERGLIDALGEITAVAIEHEHELDLLALVNYLDLYRWHLEHPSGAGVSPAVASFAAFVADAAALERAAHAVSAESGIETGVPAALLATR